MLRLKCWLWNICYKHKVVKERSGYVLCKQEHREKSWDKIEKQVAEEREIQAKIIEELCSKSND